MLSTVYLNNSILANSKRTLSDSKIFGEFIYMMSDSVLYINNTVVRNAIAKDGGAIYLLGYSNLTIHFSTFTSCSALSKGGAVYASSFDQMLIIASNFSSNKATISGDAIYAANSIGYMNVNDSSYFISTVPSNFMYLSGL